jgi:predicted extracellular nuclease
MRRAPLQALPAVTRGALALIAGAPLPAFASTSGVVISQVYGGNGVTYQADYVELFNAGTSAVSLSGWSVQYASSTGTGTFASNSPTALEGVLQPGRYWLVKLAASGTGAALPTPDATGTTNISSSAGKLIVASTATGLACNGGSTPCSPEQLAQIVDLVGYGGANFFEGTAAPALTSTTALFRGTHGCADTDVNGNDLAVGTPLPRNSEAPVAACDGGGGGTPAALYEIQGSGARSALVGQLVATQGVVTRVNNNGFFLQDATGDDDPATSDGILVFTGSTPTVQPGQLVSLTATVAEYNTGAASNPDTSAHTVTELTGVSKLQVLGTGQAIAPTVLAMPLASQDAPEAFEGMLVTLQGPFSVQQK